MLLLCVCVWRRAQRGDNEPAWKPWRFVWEEDVSQHLPWYQTLQVLPICHCCPSSCCPDAEDQRMCVSPKSVAGSLRGDSWESWNFFCHSNPHWFLQPEVMGIYLPGVEPWAGWSGLGLGSLTLKVSLPIFICHVCVGPPIPHLQVSAPLTHLDDCGFFNFLVVQLHTPQFSDNYEWYLFCSLFVIFAVGVQGGKLFYLCLHLDQKFKMKSMSLIFWKKTIWTFWPTQ